MKKIPCLFVREFRGHGDFTLTEVVTPGLEWVLEGKGTATRKFDGTACMVQNGILYKRYDVKRGKAVPAGAIACCEPDAETGHWPHWIRVGEEPESKWHAAAASRLSAPLADGTYELCGPHFSANPEKFELDTFVRHGRVEYEVERSFDGIRRFLGAHTIEGLVFWLDGEPRCKIRRHDYGLPFVATLGLGKGLWSSE